MAKKSKEVPSGKLSAAYIYENYADRDGFVSLADLKLCGWTKAKAENEGLIIKETFRTIERI